ncbi:hypothetical protein [Mycolicibacterium vaccae]|nr:hypothetical protein [Mycolicibacterium vaccae]
MTVQPPASAWLPSLLDALGRRAVGTIGSTTDTRTITGRGG